MMADFIGPDPEGENRNDAMPTAPLSLFSSQETEKNEAKYNNNNNNNKKRKKNITKKSRVGGRGGGGGGG